MYESGWRATEIPLPVGAVVVEVFGAGKRAVRQIFHETPNGRRDIHSLADLRDVIQATQADTAKIATELPAAFVYVVTELSGHSPAIFPRDSMWPDLEQRFGLIRANNEPSIENGRFCYLTYSSFSPLLKVSRLRIDLHTLDVAEESLICVPWPPARVPVAV